jgi:hypothetical protein
MFPKVLDYIIERKKHLKENKSLKSVQAMSVIHIIQPSLRPNDV